MQPDLDFSTFFKQATGFAPFPYQERLARAEAFPSLVNIPTGLGKTAAVVLAWLWRRRYARESIRRSTPRRLVYCLPMRVLVEQTARNIENWLERLGLKAPDEPSGIFLHVLMGGVDDLRSWTYTPECEAILVGTQDMLLSRALNRGYAMSRYQWSIPFALLHNDALWVLDEVQLMGPGLVTSAQLEAFRSAWFTFLPSRSVWVSATLRRDWLKTVDFPPDSLPLSALKEDDERHPDVRRRMAASKILMRAAVTLNAESAKKRAGPYLESLADEILRQLDHAQGSTLVMLNTVERAQRLYNILKKKRAGGRLILVHSRFRPPDRRRLEKLILAHREDPETLILSTQAIEAGVDLSSQHLFTELAPWSSMVQRFGRCNRFGEYEQAQIRWVDIRDDSASGKLYLPYEKEACTAAREILESLENARPDSLPPPPADTRPEAVLRRKDFLELFNTDPDLFGYDVDVGMYIRNADESDVFFFWRACEVPNDPVQPEPEAEELCRVPIGAAVNFVKKIMKKRPERRLWTWDPLAERWVPVDASRIHPGRTYLVPAEAGGYDPDTGFDPDSRVPVPEIPLSLTPEPDAYGRDHPSTMTRFVRLEDHLRHVEGEIRDLADELGLTSPWRDLLAVAARWHDVGKSHPVFQATLKGCKEADGRPDALWAKSPCRGHHGRRYFRHELASALAWLEHHSEDEHADLVAYLMAAHHGRIRMGIRALPDEDEPEDDRRFARGIWEGDELPSCSLPNGERLPPTRLGLEIMELGHGTQGDSWLERTRRLLKQYGPFRLAWLEALLRIADWRASRREEKTPEEAYEE